MIILDTNVLSELMRPAPNSKVAAWVGQQPTAHVFITTITQAEILYGIELLPQGKRRESLRSAASELFTQDLAGRILAFDSDAAVAFAKIAASRRQLGKPISHADAQIAAIAQAQNATLATHNVADFANCEINVVDPWLGA